MKLTNINMAQVTLLIGDISPATLQKDLKVSPQDFFVLPDYTMAQIKELIHFINLKPYNSQKRLAVISGAEGLNLQSANAILKTLEEPPPDAMIILTTLNEQKILPTILSRCQKIRLAVVQLSQTPINYQDPKTLGQLSIAAKFRWIQQLIEIENIANIRLILTYHQEYFRQKLLKGKDVLEILKQISYARDLLESKISVKLLLENLIINYTDGP